MVRARGTVAALLLGLVGQELGGGGAQVLWPLVVEGADRKRLYKGCAKFPSKQLILDVRVSPLHPGTPKKITEALRKCSRLFLEIWGWERMMSMLLGASTRRTESPGLFPHGP